MIQILTYTVLGFLCLQLLNVCLNVIFHQRLKQADWPGNNLVSILIPARNEEDNLPGVLNSLQNLSYQNIEILVFDDESNDGTANVVKSFAKIDQRIKLFQSDGLKESWRGKNYACYQLAQVAKGDYFLFIDADVLLNTNIIESSLCEMQKRKLSLLSVFPKQVMKTSAERKSVPVMNYILLSLLPLVFVRYSPFKAHAAANGQYMLFDAVAYRKYQPHKRFKESVVEDIRIAQFYKKVKAKVGCYLGDERISCRMYKGYDEAIAGFSKNVFMFFGGSRLLGILFWSFTSLGFIPAFILGMEWFVSVLLLTLIIRIMIAKLSRQKFGLNGMQFLQQQVFMAQVMLNAIMLERSKKLVWKGRSIA